MDVSSIFLLQKAGLLQRVSVPGDLWVCGWTKMLLNQMLKYIYSLTSCSENYFLIHVKC